MLKFNLKVYYFSSVGFCEKKTFDEENCENKGLIILKVERKGTQRRRKKLAVRGRAVYSDLRTGVLPPRQLGLRKWD